MGYTRNHTAGLLRWSIVGAMLLSFLCFIVYSWHWMLICDSPIMHYVNFLMSHGLKPYSEITDNNLPGSYLSEALAMRVFGDGDLGWRIYEFFLLAALTGAMVVIAWPYDWVAGVYGGGMFMLLHGKEGPWYSVEREQVMTMLLMWGYAALFTAVRRRQPGWMIGMGFCAAFAASIKPTVAPLSLFLLVVAALVLRRKGIVWGRYVLLGILGMAVATAVNVMFLVQHHAWHDFFVNQRVITLYYAALAHAPLSLMLHNSIPPLLALIAAGGLILAVAQGRWTWEQWTIALGAAVGLASYFQQHKGFLHHRYMFLTFLFLLVGIELMRGLQRWDWKGWLSAGLIATTLLVYLPRAVRIIRDTKGTSDLTLGVEADLNQLGGTAHLQRQVQCLDLVWGCLNGLYHLKLVENTGFTGDLIIFDPKDSEARRLHRATWWRLAQEDPAKVLVLSNENFQAKNDYGRVDNWPEYKRYLDANYTLLATRTFPEEYGANARPADPVDAHGYKIYVRNGSGLTTTKLKPVPGSTT